MKYSTESQGVKFLYKNLLFDKDGKFIIEVCYLL
jgi:hypothetical protein